MHLAGSKFYSLVRIKETMKKKLLSIILDYLFLGICNIVYEVNICITLIKQRAYVTNKKIVVIKIKLISLNWNIIFKTIYAFMVVF